MFFRGAVMNDSIMMLSQYMPSIDMVLMIMSREGHRRRGKIEA